MLSWGHFGLGAFWPDTILHAGTVFSIRMSQHSIKDVYALQTTRFFSALVVWESYLYPITRGTRNTCLPLQWLQTYCMCVCLSVTLLTMHLVTEYSYFFVYCFICSTYCCHLYVFICMLQCYRRLKLPLPAFFTRPQILVKKSDTLIKNGGS